MTNEKFDFKVLEITVSNAGVVTYPSNPTTNKGFKKVKQMAISFDDTTNLPGSLIGIKFSGKSVFRDQMETALFTFSQACPVDGRWHTLDEEQEVDQSTIELEYTPGAAFPAGDTKIHVYLKCTN